MATDASTRPLSRRELGAWRTYIETVHDLNAALEADLAAHDLSLGDYQVLVYLSEAEARSMRMVDLAAALHLTASGLTRRLDGLVIEGFVDRVPSSTDRRVIHAVLTDRGFAKLEEAYPAHLASVRRRVIDQMSGADVDAFRRVFAAIQAALCAEQQGSTVRQ